MEWPHNRENRIVRPGAGAADQPFSPKRCKAFLSWRCARCAVALGVSSAAISAVTVSRMATLPEEESFWVAVKELDLSYHDPESTLFATYPYPYYGT